MIGIIAVIAVAMVAMGAALGSVFIVSMGIRREQKLGRRLTVDSPSPLASGARAVTSLGVYRTGATWN
jgi:hypothetical protein